MPRSPHAGRTNAQEPSVAKAVKRPRRTASSERSKEFVQEAIRFFSEVGFDGGTRELAQRLGVTQPLLYRYFPSKEALIRAVYRQIFIERWNPEWDDLLANDTRPLRERLQEFYESYTDAIFTPEWLRIYLFAGLRKVEINRWYIRMIEDLILKRIAISLRRERGLASDLPISREETEVFWLLHGGIFYYGVRLHIYGLPVQEKKSTMIRNALDTFLDGVGPVITRLGNESRTP